MKISVELIPDDASWAGPTFPHGESRSAMFDGGFLALIVDMRCFIQIAAGKQQAHPLLSNAHAVELNLRPRSLGGSAEDPVRIEHNQCRLPISIADPWGDDLFPPIAIQIGQRRSEERRVGKEGRYRWSQY